MDKTLSATDQTISVMDKSLSATDQTFSITDKLCQRRIKSFPSRTKLCQQRTKPFPSRTKVCQRRTKPRQWPKRLLARLKPRLPPRFHPFQAAKEPFQSPNKLNPPSKLIQIKGTNPSHQEWKRSPRQTPALVERPDLGRIFAETHPNSYESDPRSPRFFFFIAGGPRAKDYQRSHPGPMDLQSHLPRRRPAHRPVE
jgi:hypothetical protein